jgi:superfamily II DNA or RNA helicase
LNCWVASGGEIAESVAAHADAVLTAYAADPELVEEHAGQEMEARTGGYGRRQIFELVQNGADQLQAGSGRLQVVVTDSGLYCANQGRPFSSAGLSSILHAYLSRKDDRQIGRFGLGFKSVLGVTSRPTVLSRSGSFQFSPEIAARIREAAPEAEEVPLLRIAAPLDPEAFLEDDPVVAELADWASTVVVLPFDDAEEVPWLGVAVRRFPSAFLAFADHVESLVLEDRPAGLKRSVAAERNPAGVSIREGEVADDWFVFEAEVGLDKEARDRAGKLADRDEATVKWAVRPGGGRELGQFWSYFPTDDETTLRGVLNAPWLLSEDRRRLVEGPYNETLLEGAAELVLDSIEALREHEADATTYLELMPGRGREPRCWADDRLTEKTNELMRFRPSVPLIDGELELPAGARLHPPGLPAEALGLWSTVADSANWIDHGIEHQKDRRARVERYLADAGEQAASLGEWFEAAIVDSTPETGTVVARLAGVLVGSAPDELLRRTPFVLTEALEYSRVGEPGLMLPGGFERDAVVTLVHAAVAADDEARAALEAMGVCRVSAEVELRRLVAEGDENADWERFWVVARQVPSARVAEIVEAEHGFTPRVMTLAGEFRAIAATLLPGACVPADGSRDRGVAIDLEWHRDEVRLLKSLGCTDGPGVGARPADEPWFPEFRRLCIKEFLRVNEPARPSEEAIEIVSGSPIMGPMGALRSLGEEGVAALTQMALQGLDEPHPWAVRHRTRDRYSEASMPNPSLWLIREEGLLPTPLGHLPVADCVGSGLALGDLVPAPSCSIAAARALGLPARWADVPGPVIERCLAAAAASPAAAAGRLYAVLALEPAIDPPESLRCLQAGVATVAPRESVVVSDDESVGELLAQGSACVLPVSDPDQKRALVESWGLTDAAELVSRRIAVAPLGDPVPLLDEFRPLRRRIDPSQRSLEIQRCEEIRIVEEAVGGTRSSDVDFARDGNRLYCLGDLGPQTVLRRIGRELGIKMPADEIERVLRGVEDRRVKDLTREVRGLGSDAERLAALLEQEALRSRLPRSVLEVYIDLHGEPTPLQLAELAISVHGTDVIKAYAEELEASGFTPPSSWRGGRAAREFVRSLGFPPELAGFQSESRPPELVVEGRPKLPPLHEYQRSIAGEMCLLFQRDKDNRAMLTLPTGSGKTRVAIEACIDALADRTLSSDLILWVAQSHELCDQAVQAWSELWRARELDSRLTIGRLWASNDVGQATDGPQVVVATIHKLQNVLGEESYEWLSRPGAVLIDEAHGSIAPIYTKLLEWLGLERGKIGAPLVGLSATPYRGRSKEQTERLAARYGNRRLDVAVLGEGDHYPQLQEMGVISRVVHETLEGAEISLSEEQIASVRESGLLPKAADTRLGEDIARSRRLLDHVGALPDDWPVLIFAASVENAQALAGLLNHAGISAASISAETPAEARRWYLRRFREGELRVITNYSVLAEGFDAPSVRAVYVARPVFAPNRYQQMVGRGLRGPLNGGKEECLIVDVEDNVLNLDELLAFHRFEYLWNPDWAEAVASG